jgi:pyroglutamyl-peptidase
VLLSRVGHVLALGQGRTRDAHEDQREEADGAAIHGVRFYPTARGIMRGMAERVIVVTGFEAFGPHGDNPSQALAKAVDGRRVRHHVVRGAVLPVHHADAAPRVAALVAEARPDAILHLGLAGGRARVALERVAVNVMDYALPDNAGRRIVGEACAPGGPAAYFSTLPLRSLLADLTAEGIPAYISNTAGTYLCNQTLYGTLHALAAVTDPPRVGFVHFPSLPSMVAASGLDEPSMDLGLMLRAVEVILEGLARDAVGA